MSKISLATLYGIGLVKYGPGTTGSFAAAFLAWILLQCPYGWLILAIGTVLFTVLGITSANHYMKTHTTAHDPSEIVIDELAGQWLTYLIWYLMIAGASAPSGVTFSQLEIDTAPHFLGLGFVLFRLFDILKPWPISFIDRKVKGGFGVMFDDLVAALPAGVLLYFAYVFWPLIFGGLETMP